MFPSCVYTPMNIVFLFILLCTYILVLVIVIQFRAWHCLFFFLLLNGGYMFSSFGTKLQFQYFNCDKKTFFYWFVFVYHFSTYISLLCRDKICSNLCLFYNSYLILPNYSTRHMHISHTKSTYLRAQYNKILYPLRHVWIFTPK